MTRGPLVRNRLDDYTCDIHLHYQVENNILFVESRGNTNCEFFRFTENDDLQYLNKYQGAQVCQGMSFVPRRHLNI